MRTPVHDLVANYFPPNAGDIVWYMFSRPYVRPSIHPFLCSSVKIHNLVTTELNFMKLVLNMYFLNDVTHVKFGQAVFSST